MGENITVEVGQVWEYCDAILVSGETRQRTITSTDENGGWRACDEQGDQKFGKCDFLVKHAKLVKAVEPVCLLAKEHVCLGPILRRVLGKVDGLFCDWAARSFELQIGQGYDSGILRNAKIPERIDRRLAHVAGMHDDDLRK